MRKPLIMSRDARRSSFPFPPVNIGLKADGCFADVMDSRCCLKVLCKARR